MLYLILIIVTGAPGRGAGFFWETWPEEKPRSS